MNYFKKIKYFVFGFICFLVFCVNVSAASVSVKASASSITKGKTVTFTAVVSSSSPIVSIEGSLSCSGAGVNGGTSLTFDDSSNSVYSKSFTYTAKPTSTGNVTCTVSGARITDMGSGNWQNLGNSSVSVSVKDPVVIPPKVYSSDNNLSSLSVEGYNITPKFSKDTLDYKLEVDESVEKINVSAKANDSKAKVSGTGEKVITPGENVIKVTVTAENGNDKVYKIVITSVDQNPINVKIDNNDYTVVKKNNDAIDKLEHYKETVIKIDDKDVISYTNDKSGITLVLLKDKDGEVNYYTYNEENGTYELYKEYKIGNISLNIFEMDEKKLPLGYQKYDLTIGEDKLVGYKINKDSSFYLINAMNVENGDKSLYVYDEKEGTIQRYDEEISKYFSASIKEVTDDYKNYFYIALSGLVAVTIVLIVVLITKRKGKIRKNKLKV